MEAVSIGCFWFARRRDSTPESAAAYLGQFVKALESLESITSLDVLSSDNLGYQLINDEDEEDDDPDFLSPIFHGVSISFDLSVPFRLHEQYLYPGEKADVERFHIRIVYLGIMPVAYVYYAVGGGESDVHKYSPSRAVVVARKYLEEKINDSPAVSFRMLGPSPAWVDVFVERAPAGAPVTAKDLSEGEGYRTFYYRYDAPTDERLLDQLIRNNHRVLSEFYSLVRLRNRANAAEALVVNGAMELLRPVPSGRWAALRHWRNYRAEIDEVFTALLTEKMERVDIERHTAALLSNTAVDKSSLFYWHINNELKDLRRDVPDEDIRELLVMLEERRRGYFENFTTLFSGLVGGLLGAALGAFLTFSLGEKDIAKMPALQNPAIKSSVPPN